MCVPDRGGAGRSGVTCGWTKEPEPSTKSHVARKGGLGGDRLLLWALAWPNNDRSASVHPNTLTLIPQWEKEMMEESTKGGMGVDWWTSVDM